ncbi:MAG TPA: hypothetical protein VIN57_03005 [Magnetovibrio sp.]
MSELSTVQNFVWNYLKTGVALPFRVFSFFMGHYIRNRNRLKAFMSQPGASTTFTIIISITMLVWIGVVLFSTEADRTRLTDAVMGLWQDTQELNAEKQRLDAIRDQQGTQQ